MEKYDVIIIGGGLVGGALALALADLGLRLCVIDQEDPGIVLSQAVDGRSFALSRSSYHLFSRLQVWENLETAPSPIEHIVTSDGASGKSTHFEDPSNPMGYLVASLDLRRTILKRALATKSITWKAPQKYTDIIRDDIRAVVTLEDGTTLEAPLLLGADGRFSALRDLMGIETVKISSPQRALVFNVSHTLPHHQTAYEHFTPFGPLAFLPLGAHESACVWSLKEDKAQDLLALTPEALAEEIYAVFGSALGTFTLITSTWSYPLSIIFPKRLTAQRFALVGDAAHAFHPVAGQGLNLGLGDVGALYDIIQEGRYTGVDLGSFVLLDQYQRARQLDHLAMMAFCEGMVKLFSNRSKILKHLRGWGIGAVENISPLKDFMIHQATGDNPKAPSLLRVI